MTTDPITIAHEVVRQHGHLDLDALSRREKEHLDLARAVLDFAAKTEKVRALHQSAGEQLDDYGYT